MMNKKTITLGVICFIVGFVFASAIYTHLFLFTNVFPHKNDSNIKSSAQETPSNVPVEKQENKFHTKTIPIVAVSSLSDEGVVGNLTVRLIPGNANVLIDTNPFLETDLQYSANIAVTVAKLTTGIYAGDKDFVLSYAVDSDVIGGESAGAATTIATIAALQDKSIKEGVLITGVINHDGSIGRVGGILEKAKAAADAGYKKFLVPEGQTKVKYYEKVIEEEPFGYGLTLLNTHYVPKVIDLAEEAKKEWGIEILEVSTIEDAMQYMLE